MNNWGKEKYDQTDHIEPPTWCKYYKSLLNSSSLSREHSYTRNHTTFDPTLCGRTSTAEISGALKQLKSTLPYPQLTSTAPPTTITFHALYHKIDQT